MTPSSRSLAAARAAAARPLVLTITAGLLAGVLAKAADNLDPALGSLTSYAGLWVVLVALLGRRAGSLIQACVWSVGFLLAMTAAYYLTYHLSEGNGRWIDVIFWSAASLIAGPFLAAAGYLTRSVSWWGSLAVATLAGLLTGDLFLMGWGRKNWLTMAFDGCAAIVLVLAAPIDTRTRRQAIALTVPGMAIGLALIRSVPILFRMLGGG